jgi:carboxymethylenebutenolidase
MESRERVAAAGPGGVPLDTVLADAGLAHRVAAGLEHRTLTLPRAGTVTAAVGMPKTLPAPVVVLIHEWWGLNDQIQTMGVHMAELGYVTIAVDLMNGRVATTIDDAAALSARVDSEVAREIMVGWIEWARRQPFCNGQVATLGWCFGGGLSLMAALSTPVEATVVYYGLMIGSASKLKALKGPVLAHFALLDEFVPPLVAARFETEMAAAGKKLESYMYMAGHGFANPTGNHYHREDAQLAWQRTTRFLTTALSKS